jgi:hypothetical protein
LAKAKHEPLGDRLIDFAASMVRTQNARLAKARGEHSGPIPGIPIEVCLGLLCMSGLVLYFLPSSGRYYCVGSRRLFQLLTVLGVDSASGPDAPCAECKAIVAGVTICQDSVVLDLFAHLYSFSRHVL